MAEVTTSKKFALNLQDLGKGFLVAILSGFVMGLYQLLQAGGTPTVSDLKAIGLASLTGGLAYIIKNFFTPQQTIVKGEDKP